MADIQFKNVSFRYEEAPEDCLSEISLTIKAGEFVVLTGKKWLR